MANPDPQREVTPGEPPSKASVIIRTKNEAKDLARTLTGVFGQTLEPHEVIVIDSGSTDDTVAIARRFPVILREIAPEEWSYSRALNMGAERATGDVLVCLSAHCEPVTDRWLESLCGHLADPTVAGVWGPSLRPNRDRPTGGEPHRQVPGSYTVENRMWGLSNGNSAIRRSLWCEVPFDEAIPATEDKAWGLAMLNRGYVIVHEPAAGVWHEAHTATNDFHRAVAVQAGFRQMFPELNAPYSSQVAVIVRRARILLVTRFHDRDLAALRRDLARGPGVVAAVLGGVIGVRPGAMRARWAQRRHALAPLTEDSIELPDPPATHDVAAGDTASDTRCGAA